MAPPLNERTASGFFRGTVRSYMRGGTRRYDWPDHNLKITGPDTSGPRWAENAPANENAGKPDRMQVS